MVNLTTYELRLMSEKRNIKDYKEMSREKLNFATYELKLIAGKRGIKNYRDMSREKLLRTLDESQQIFENLLQMALIELQKCRIFHKMNLSKSQKCRIFHKMN